MKPANINQASRNEGHLEKYRFTLKHRLRLMSWPASALGSGRGKADFSRCPEFRYTGLNMGLIFSINHLSPSQSTPEYAIGSEWRTYKHNP